MKRILIISVIVALSASFIQAQDRSWNEYKSIGQKICRDYKNTELISESLDTTIQNKETGEAVVIKIFTIEDWVFEIRTEDGQTTLMATSYGTKFDVIINGPISGPKKIKDYFVFQVLTGFILISEETSFLYTQ